MSDEKLLLKVAAYLRTELFPDINPLSQRTLLGLYRLVALGEPVTVDSLSDAVGLNGEVVKNLLGDVEVSRFHYDEAGRIKGFSGLSQEPTGHGFFFEGRQLFTWCAFDALFLPQLLGSTALVSSRCPVTDDDISLSVTPTGLGDQNPEGVMMSFVMPDAETCSGNLRGAFCNHVNFLSSPEAGRVWQQRHQAAAILTVGEAFQLGRVRNNACFRDVLTEI